MRPLEPGGEGQREPVAPVSEEKKNRDTFGKSQQCYEFYAQGSYSGDGDRSMHSQSVCITTYVAPVYGAASEIDPISLCYARQPLCILQVASVSRTPFPRTVSFMFLFWF